MKDKGIIAAGVAALLLIGAGHAGADQAANRCGGSKAKAAARFAKDLFSCHAFALRTGEAVDSGCTATAEARLASGFDKAEALGGCITTDDEAGAQAIVDAARAAVDALISPDPTPEARTCAATKMKSSGVHIHSRLRCYGKTAARGLGPTGGCLEGSSERIEAGFAAAENRGGCTSTGDVGAVTDIGEDAVEDLVRALSPVCGDSIVGPSQECDASDDATCPGLCDDSCECDVPPVCGDGESELPEECDDGGMVDGDGCSAGCELENEGALCTGITPVSGTNINAVFVTDDLTVPTFLTAPRLDPVHVYITERAGFIRILDLAEETVSPTPFLDISDLTTTGGERGLFSMAFDPDYDNNGRFYISYTNLDGDLVLARYEVDSGDPAVADESTRKELLVVPHPSAANHNGGQVQFGGDGYLYWSMGDGGGGVNSQDDGLLLGKLLRLDVNHSSAPYATPPPSNPGYVDGSSDIEYVWAKGLRNPWRFSFDRLTGDLYIGDVGGQQVEEIDFTPASSTGGENYGWGIFEGSRCRMEPCPDPPTGFTFPVHEYNHGKGCAVMGGYAYRGCAMADYAGIYFFSDLCGVWVRTFKVVGGAATEFADRTNDAKSSGATFAGVVSWGEDARGEIYMISNNTIYRIEPQ